MKFSYGGQALIEGVMIRGQGGVAVAVRNPQGQIVTHTEKLEGGLYRTSFGRLPFVRGVLALWETVTVGTRMLLFSASVASGLSDGAEPPKAVTGTVATTLSIAVAFFFVAPSLLLNRATKKMESSLASNLLEGCLRLGMFIGYIALISRLDNIRRVFAYHGAEHKAVHAYEHDVPLTPAEVQKFPTAHPRCGTAFLLQMMVISTLVYSLFGRPSLGRRLALRVVLVPLLSSLSYELLRLGARDDGFILTRLFVGPGLALQALTTREPDDAQVEVAIAAMRGALALDNVASDDIPSSETEEGLV